MKRFVEYVATQTLTLPFNLFFFLLHMSLIGILLIKLKFASEIEKKTTATHISMYVFQKKKWSPNQFDITISKMQFKNGAHGVDLSMHILMYILCLFFFIQYKYRYQFWIERDLYEIGYQLKGHFTMTRTYHIHRSTEMWP